MQINSSAAVPPTTNEGVHELVKELCRILARQESVWFDEQLATDSIPVNSWGIGKVDLRGIPLEIVPPKKPTKFKIGPASEGIITDTSVEQSRWVITSHECREEEKQPEPKQETWRDRPPLL